MSRRDGDAHDPSERLCWLYSPVCLERWEEARGGEPPFRLIAELMRKTVRALSRRVLVWGTRPC